MTPSIYSGAFADLLTASRGQQPGWGMPGHPNHQPPGSPGMTDPPMGPPGMVARQNMTPPGPMVPGPQSSLLYGNNPAPTPPPAPGQPGIGGQMPGYPGFDGGFGWGGMFGFPQMPNNRPAFSAPGMSNVYPGGRPPFGNYNPFFGGPNQAQSNVPTRDDYLTAMGKPAGFTHHGSMNRNLDSYMYPSQDRWGGTTGARFRIGGF